MADHKFTLEEILNEYSADGKRSGIRHTSVQPLSRGTLETEKLVMMKLFRAMKTRSE